MKHADLEEYQVRTITIKTPEQQDEWDRMVRLYGVHEAKRRVLVNVETCRKGGDGTGVEWWNQVFYGKKVEV